MAPSAVPVTETPSGALAVKSQKEALVNGRPASQEPKDPTPLEAISHGVVMPGTLLVVSRPFAPSTLQPDRHNSAPAEVPDGP